MRDKKINRSTFATSVSGLNSCYPTVTYFGQGKDNEFVALSPNVFVKVAAVEKEFFGFYQCSIHYGIRDYIVIRRRKAQKHLTFAIAAADIESIEILEGEEVEY